MVEFGANTFKKTSADSIAKRAGVVSIRSSSPWRSLGESTLSRS